MLRSRSWYMANLHPLFAPDGDGGGGEGGGESGGSNGSGGDPLAGLTESALKAIQDRVNSAAAAARKESEKAAKALQDRLDAIEERDQTDLEKAQSRVTELEKHYGEATTQLQQERAEKAIRDAAASAGARADRLPSVYRLVRDEVEFGDDGKPSNVAALIEQAKTDAPEFFQRVSGSGDGGKTGDTKVEITPGMPRLAHAYKEKVTRR